MPRDLSKILSDADTLKLRALLAQHPDVESTGILDEYPKMLFSPGYWERYIFIRTTKDPVARKEAVQQIHNFVVAVHDIETEEEYLTDGYKTDPVQFLLDAGEKDPRVPTGREGRRALEDERVSREQEIRNLKRRFAQLTAADGHGQRLEDAVLEVGDASGSGQTSGPGQTEPQRVNRRATKPVPASGKRARASEAAQRAMGVRGGTTTHA